MVELRTPKSTCEIPDATERRLIVAGLSIVATCNLRANLAEDFMASLPRLSAPRQRNIPEMMAAPRPFTD